MDAEKYGRSVAMLCPTCGSSQFAYDDENDDGLFRCVSCDRELTREELIRENDETIQAHASEMGAEVLRDAAKELRDSLRKTFSGSKHIKFK